METEEGVAGENTPRTNVLQGLGSSGHAPELPAGE